VAGRAIRWHVEGHRTQLSYVVDVMSGPVSVFLSEDTPIFRAMKRADDGKPVCGSQYGHELGARPGFDIPVALGGRVNPETGGMSVTPADPLDLPFHRKPEWLGGSGKHPVWSVPVSDLQRELTTRSDPSQISHAFVEPAEPMLLDLYQSLLMDTRPSWSEYGG
jgi:hypothetical protein